MKRTFWLSAGLAAGATAAVLTSRFLKRQAQKMAPANIAREAKDDVMTFAQRVSASIEEGKRAAAEAEREVRDGLDPPVD